MPDDQIIPKGQQIGLLIFSSDKNFTICPEPGTKLTIDPNGTTITLPILNGIASYRKATE
jgi:X-Pro dipeptidyl-peptidase